MRIVKTTNPPSMAVVVDTIVSHEVTMVIAPADPQYERIDVVCIANGMVTVITGSSGYHPLPPRVNNMRILATIYIPHGVSQVMPYMIKEES